MRVHPRRILTALVACLLIVLFRATLLHVEIGDGFNMERAVGLPRPGHGKDYLVRVPKLPWVLRATSTKPTSGPPRVWPSGFNETDDRIVNQLHFIPDSLRRANANSTKVKSILVYTGMPTGIRPGRSQFFIDKCAVNKCSLISDRKLGQRADVVLWQQAMYKTPWKKPPNQIWALYFLESPMHTPDLREFRNLINWTATYRRDSTLVTPYEKFVPFENPKRIVKNYAAGKTKKVAWFVSNCGAKSRSDYVKELQKHIQVDIYGACGPFKCARLPGGKCERMLSKDYKFYLSFENSNCKDYITEKLYWNAYLNDIVPVVMGARPIDYILSSPPHSFINVDDFKSAKQLADYLKKLDANDNLYNEYFRWKGTGSFINTKFWCRLCALAHDTSRNTWYEDVHDWWHGEHVCTTPRGRKWASWNGIETARPKRTSEPIVIMNVDKPTT